MNNNITLDHNCSIGNLEYIDATINPPKQKGQMYLLSVTGKATIGTYVEGFHVGWFPLLKRPSTLTTDKLNELLTKHLQGE